MVPGGVTRGDGGHTGGSGCVVLRPVWVQLAARCRPFRIRRGVETDGRAEKARSEHCSPPQPCSADMTVQRSRTHSMMRQPEGGGHFQKVFVQKVRPKHLPSAQAPLVHGARRTRPPRRFGGEPSTSHRQYGWSAALQNYDWPKLLLAGGFARYSQRDRKDAAKVLPFRGERSPACIRSLQLLAAECNGFFTQIMKMIRCCGAGPRHSGGFNFAKRTTCRILPYFSRRLLSASGWSGAIRMPVSSSAADSGVSPTLHVA
jgi:hypothetical protein